MNLNPFRHQKTVTIKKDDFPQFLSLLSGNVSSNDNDQTDKHFQGVVTADNIFLHPIPNYFFDMYITYFTVTANRETTNETDTLKITFLLELDRSGLKSLLPMLLIIIAFGTISYVLSLQSYLGANKIGLIMAPCLCIFVIIKLSIQFSTAQGALSGIFTNIGNKLGYRI